MANLVERLVVGIDLPPWLIATARMAILAGAAGVIGVVLTQAEAMEWGDYAWASPIVLLILRQGEGLIDQWRTPKQNDAP